MYPPKTEEYAQTKPVPGIPANPSPTHTHFQTPTLQWSSGLCDCSQDIGNCCITCCCPCITFGQIAEIVDRGSSSCGASGALYGLLCALTGCQCVYSCAYRSKLRALYSLPESPCADILVHCFCEPCALCQAHRELNNRGFDLTIGWQANMEKQGHAVVQPPFAQGGMMR